MPPTAAPSPLTLARTIYAGVALASGGIALYVPLVLAVVGSTSSGTWAAAILFATNLGRVLGAWIASRQALWTERPAAAVAAILLEGLALFAMIAARTPVGYAAAALAAGIGSGLSFPAMKGWLLRLHELPPPRLFAGLSLALRLGMLWGYGLGAFLAPQHLPVVFGAALATFAAYAAAMHVALRHIAARPVPAAAGVGDGGASAAPAAAPDLPLPQLIAGCAVFWFLVIQPTAAMSLHVARYVPALPLTATYAVTTIVILALQARVTACARDLRDHRRFLVAGAAALAAGFATMAVGATQAGAVLVAAVLIAVGQVLFVPSSDVLVTAHARARGTAAGPLLARQLFHQNVGVMLGSLAAGALFDLGVAWHRPGLGWAVGAAAGALLAGAFALAPQRRRG